MKIKKILLATTIAVALVFSPQKKAEAAPLAGIIGAAVGGLGTLGTAILGTALSIAGNWLMQKLFAEEPKPQGVKQRMDSGGDNPISFIVGKYATAGKLVYVNSYGEDAKGLIMVISLSEIPVTALSSKIVINGKVCDIDFGNTDSDGFDKVTQYQEDGRNFCSLKFFNDPSSAPDFLMDTFGSDPVKPWTNNMIGRGCSYVVVYCRFSTDGVWAGIPQFKFVCQGIPLYDPRKDSSVGGSGSHRWGNKATYEFSENVSVISYNIIRGISRGGDKIYGGNAKAAQLPLDIWFAAMNTCDENVTKAAGGTVKRFIAGAEISVDIAPMDTLRELDNSSSGYTFEFGGIWKTFVGGPGASVVTITDDDILVSSEQVDNLFKPLQETYNVAQASYPEPNACWEQKDSPTRYFDDYIEEDGEELSMNMEFPYVWEKNQVQRLVRAAIRDSRNQRVHTLVLPPAYAGLEAYDVFTWNSTRNGYVNKKFMILQKDDMPNCSQNMVVRELNPDDYDWDTTMELEDSVGDLDGDRPSYNKDFTVFADIIDRPGGKKDKPAVRAEWDWADEDLDIRVIQWRARNPGTTKIIAHGAWHDYQQGTRTFTHPVFHFGKSYEIQFRVIPRSQRKSAWTSWKTVNFATVLVPTGLTLTPISNLGRDGKLDFFVVATWDEVDQEENGYGVKVIIDGETEHVRADGNRKRIPVKAPSSVTISVRTRASEGGSPSLYCTPITVSVTKKSVAPTTPSQLDVVGKHRRAVVKTEDHPDNDFRRWNFYYSKTNNFTTANKTKHSRNNRFVLDDLDHNENYFGWLTAEDTSGNESAKYPASSTGGFAFDTKNIDDDDTGANNLAAPTGLSITKIQEVNDDGAVHTFLELDCNAPGWAGEKASYIYEVTVEDRVKPYKVKSGDPPARFRVNRTGKSHSVRVRAKSGVGRLSSWSGTVSMTPSKKPVGGVPAVGTVTVTPKKSRIKLDWVDIDDDVYKDYKKTFIYRNTTGVTPTVGVTAPYKKTSSGYFIDENVTTGVTYYYWICHRDQSGNFSGLVFAFGSSGGNEVTYFADLSGYVASSQINTGTIVTNHIDTGAVTTPTIAVNAASGSAYIHNTGAISVSSSGGETSIASLSINVTDNQDVAVGIQHINIDSVDRSYTIRIYKDSVLIFELGAKVPAGSLFFTESIFTGHTGTSAVYDYRVLAGVSHFVANRAIFVRPRKR